jgi:anti-anti-sigma regulatory factor
MEFKIDTKPSYTIITPVANVIDANLTGALAQKRQDLSESGGINLIVDLHNCLEAHPEGISALTDLHETSYSEGSSLVFTGLQDEVLDLMKQQGIDSLINIAPTMIEAADIISMEILERDLFNEES